MMDTQAEGPLAIVTEPIYRKKKSALMGSVEMEQALKKGSDSQEEPEFPSSPNSDQEFNPQIDQAAIKISPSIRQ